MLRGHAQIHSIEPLASIGPAPIQELYVAANKVSAITGLSQLTQITTLELGSNRIKTVSSFFLRQRGRTGAVHEQQ